MRKSLRGKAVALPWALILAYSSARICSKVVQLVAHIIPTAMANQGKGKLPHSTDDVAAIAARFEAVWKTLNGVAKCMHDNGMSNLDFVEKTALNTLFTKVEKWADYVEKECKSQLREHQRNLAKAESLAATEAAEPIIAEIHKGKAARKSKGQAK